MVNQALSTWLAQTAKVLPHPSLHSKIVNGGEHNKKLRILLGQNIGEKMNEVLEGEEIKNTVVKFKRTRHSPERVFPVFGNGEKSPHAVHNTE